MLGTNKKLNVSGTVWFLDDDIECDWADSDLSGMESEGDEDSCQAADSFRSNDPIEESQLYKEESMSEIESAVISSSSSQGLTSTPTYHSPQSLSTSSVPFVQQVGPTTRQQQDMSPLDYLNIFSGKQTAELLVRQTNLYATQRLPAASYKWHDTEENEICHFLGILIAWAYIHCLLWKTTGPLIPCWVNQVSQLACHIVATEHSVVLYTSMIIAKP